MKEALALAGGGRQLSAREEEMLALLAGFPDGGGSDRELSFSDLVEAGARPPNADLCAPAPRDDRPTAAASKQQWLQAAGLRARRSGGSRGSCGGGGDGVLLNFYVPGLLTRSMTTPRPSRGLPSPGAVQGAPAKPVAAAAAPRKASRTQMALGIGCWPALWGRGRRPAKACS
ncbi:unnamed protein product [Miscanthus lutarioriparius]|uniref:Uncharacterized protein n=1 Tax=Miscanthus lutarioriparius TaxID=422564 RepID=A0A811RPE8_9POAL|nr:unnamed protein product [Miscanthus lutarioriparius]